MKARREGGDKSVFLFTNPESIETVENKFSINNPTSTNNSSKSNVIDSSVVVDNTTSPPLLKRRSRNEEETTTTTEESDEETKPLHKGDDDNDDGGGRQGGVQSPTSSLLLSEDRPMTLFEVARTAVIFCPIWFAANYSFNKGVSMTSVSSNTVLSSTSSTLFPSFIPLPPLASLCKRYGLLSFLYCSFGLSFAFFFSSFSLSFFCSVFSVAL